MAGDAGEDACTYSGEGQGTSWDADVSCTHTQSVSAPGGVAYTVASGRVWNRVCARLHSGDVVQLRLQEAGAKQCSVITTNWYSTTAENLIEKG